MNQSNPFHPAPWGTPLIVVSVLATLLCAGSAVLTARYAPPAVAWTAWLVLALPLACAPFVVRGYRVEGKVLWVRRLWWETRVSLHGLSEARHDPEALRRSIRLWGNGGFYSFTGWFRNRKLGTYRAYGTDPSNAVVIKLRQRTIVVTPHDPAAFVTAVREHQKPT
jgi:hypothetical protein